MVSLPTGRGGGERMKGELDSRRFFLLYNTRKRRQPIKWKSGVELGEKEISLLEASTPSLHNSWSGIAPDSLKRALEKIDGEKGHP